MKKNGEINKINEGLSEKEVETLIDKKILEARVTISEKRLNYFLIIAGGFFIIFGIFFPMWLATQSTDKVDKALESFEERFEKLVGMEIREPDIDVFVMGKKLLDSILLVKNGRSISNQNPIDIRNIGDGVAKDVSVRLYFDALGHFYPYAPWIETDIMDEPKYKRVFQMAKLIPLIAPKDSVNIGPKLEYRFYRNIEVDPEGKPLPTNIDETSVDAMIKVYYGGLEPKVIRFKIQRRK